MPVERWCLALIGSVADVDSAAESLAAAGVLTRTCHAKSTRTDSVIGSGSRLFVQKGDRLNAKHIVTLLLHGHSETVQSASKEEARRIGILTGLGVYMPPFAVAGLVKGIHWLWLNRCSRNAEGRRIVWFAVVADVWIMSGWTAFALSALIETLG